MKPPPRAKTDYEHVPKYDEWINGKIAEIQYEEEHETTYQGEKKVRPAVRFKFALDGCKFPKYSRWLTFSYGEKANLYKNFLTYLVEDAEPDMDFDMDALKDFPVKTMWVLNEEFDNLTQIRALNEKLKAVPF